MLWRWIIATILLIGILRITNSASPEVFVANSGLKQSSEGYEDQKKQSISIVDDDFMLNGQPLQIMSGSLHYFRLPAQYWQDRLQKLKAAGLNSVSTYVEWSYHEPEEGSYDFSGDRDLAQFIRLAAQEGLHVLLRPGPYICAERDLGGLPYWLLSKYPNIRLRTTDEDFLKETRIWFDRLFKDITPLLFGNGGPIILVQVENEYGSYGSSRAYMENIRDIIVKHVGQNALLYTTDGYSPNLFGHGSVSGALTTIDFGTGTNIDNHIADLRKFMPHGPIMNSEFYPGWLTHWGETFQKVDTAPVIVTLREMINRNMSVNFYMFFGGSNFEFSAGANFGPVYQPDITSYDYDAPLSEAGDPTHKYFEIRKVLEKRFPSVKDIPIPVPQKKGAYGKITVTPVVQLLSPDGLKLLGKQYGEFQNESLPTFEKLRQRSGLVLYETVVSTNYDIHILKIMEPRDRVYVYVDDVLQGLVSRAKKTYRLNVILKNNSKLSLLVENQGRINYGNKLHDFKGILSPIKLNGTTLQGPWKVTGFPLENVNVTACQDVVTKGAVLYEGFLDLPSSKPLDTFLDTTGLGKGYVWINGHNIGRYWSYMGPQITMYVPGVWLNSGKNHIQVLELEVPAQNLTLDFIDHPILDKPKHNVFG